jgi:hypothetical protein
MRHTLLFRFEPKADTDIEKNTPRFHDTVYMWSKSKQDAKLADIFGHDVHISPPVLALYNTVFEVRLTHPDDTWKPSPISTEDLTIALGLDPSEWTIWRLF